MVFFEEEYAFYSTRRLIASNWQLQPFFNVFTDQIGLKDWAHMRLINPYLAERSRRQENKMY